MDKSILFIQTFDGDRTKFSLWLDSLRENAIAFEEITGAVSCWLFTPEEWATLPYAGYTQAEPAVEAIAANPDAVPPVLARAARPAIDEVFAEIYQVAPMPAINNQAHTILSETYYKQQFKRAEFKTALTNALTVKVKNTISALHNNAKIYNIQPAEIIRLLREEYGALRAKDITNLRQQLTKPYIVGDNISDFIDNHINIHQILALSNQAQTENQKIENLRKALELSGQYELVMTMFDSIFTDIRTTTFREFTTRIKNFNPPPTTTASLGFSAAATKPTYEDLEAEIKSLKSKNRPASRNKTRREYCWSHGSCDHKGSACKTPKDGHIAEATYWKRQGGSNDRCNKG